LCLALSAHGAIDVRRDGNPVADAELCWFKGFDANVACGAKLPPGTWSVFARRAPDLVSDRVLTFDTSDNGSHTLNLVKARRAEGAGQFAYVTATGSAYPITPNALTPEGARTVNLTASNGKITGASGANLVVPVTFASIPSGKIAAPRVVIGERKPIEPLPLLAAGESTLLFFRGVPNGASTITIGGDRWKSVDAKIDVKDFAMLDKPLVANASSKLVVHWWTPVDLAKLAPPDRPCGKKPADPDPVKGFSVELQQCVRRNCTPVAMKELPLDAMRGSVEFPDVASGTYVLRFHHERLPEFAANAAVKTDAQTEMDVEIRYLTFFGKVTRAKKPVHARVFDAVTDPQTGEYVAIMRRLPPSGSAPFNVAFCDGGDDFWFVPERGPVENAAYDIELPDNRVIVDVIDRDTKLPIEKARVSEAALMDKESHSAYFAGMGGATNDKGRYVFEPIEIKKEMMICASRDDYENACADGFVMGDDHERHIELALKKVKVHQGQVMLGGDMLGRIDWHTRDGVMTETATVKPDGTFSYKRSHAEGEIVTYGSRKQPFITMLQPHLGDDDTLQIRVPNGARVRTFDVALSPSSHEQGAWITIMVGDVVVPANSLGFHMQMHDQQSSIRPGASTTLVDIAEMAPLRVMLVLMNVVRGAPPDERRDYALRADLMNAYPKQEVGEKTRVEFP